MAKIKISLWTCKTPQRRVAYNQSVLKTDKILQHLYTVTVQNRYAELCEDKQDITQTYENLIQSSKEAADQLIPRKKRRYNNKNYDDPRIVEARKTHRMHFQNIKQIKYQDIKSNYKHGNSYCNQLMRKFQKMNSEIIREIENMEYSE